MDAEQTALVVAVLTGLVKSMASDAWQPVKSVFVRLFGRGRKDREERVAGSLEESREAVLAGEDPERVSATWRGRLEALLDEDPSVVDELRAVLREIEHDAPSVRQTVHAEGNARVNVAGRDQYIGRDR